MLVDQRSFSHHLGTLFIQQFPLVLSVQLLLLGKLYLSFNQQDTGIGLSNLSSQQSFFLFSFPLFQQERGRSLKNLGKRTQIDLRVFRPTNAVLCPFLFDVTLHGRHQNVEQASTSNTAGGEVTYRNHTHWGYLGCLRVYWPLAMA